MGWLIAVTGDDGGGLQGRGPRPRSLETLAAGKPTGGATVHRRTSPTERDTRRTDYRENVGGRVIVSGNRSRMVDRMARVNKSGISLGSGRTIGSMSVDGGMICGALQRETQTLSPYVFVSERGAPLSVAGYQRMVARAGETAGFSFLIHSHMLRHSCGYKLANDGQDTRAIQHYLGHRSIASTVRYTALAPDRFKHFWKG